MDNGKRTGIPGKTPAPDSAEIAVPGYVEHLARRADSRAESPKWRVPQPLLKKGVEKGNHLLALRRDIEHSLPVRAAVLSPDTG